MSSRFPGMDPYLEAPFLWPAFHHELVAYLSQILAPLVGQRYIPEIAQRIYVTEDRESSSTAQHECAEEYFEIRQQSDGRLVTLLDVVSPGNKSTTIGRQAYLDTLAKAKAAPANLVEIDLVMQGQPTLNYSREGLPEWDHAVTVTRATQPERYEIYTAKLQKRLPKFRLPLAANDRDTVIDLQATFTSAYDQGGFAAKIDYHSCPPVPVTQEQAVWLQQFLGLRELPQVLSPEARKLRFCGHHFSHETIAALAYRLWEQDGRLAGRDGHYWYAALAQLRHEKQ